MATKIEIAKEILTPLLEQVDAICEEHGLAYVFASSIPLEEGITSAVSASIHMTDECYVSEEFELATYRFLSGIGFGEQFGIDQALLDQVEQEIEAAKEINVNNPTKH